MKVISTYILKFAEADGPLSYYSYREILKTIDGEYFKRMPGGRLEQITQKDIEKAMRLIEEDRDAK